ncbi:hypothetical protein BaRGS_00034284, partial [Batillaria attramentaria]
GISWEYTGALGPSEWHTVYPDCGGRMQSPINIMENQVLYDPSMEVFDIRQYGTCTDCKMTLMNVGGHTAEVKYSGTPIGISGGSLPDDYVLDQFHFHWGSNNDKGSEHTIDFKAAPLELHIVHYMKSSFNSSEAARHPYGLAVLGFFFKLGKHNENFDYLLAHFPNITHKDEETELEPFPLKSLLPANASTYYRYFGSLTTPPCYETVIWTLFREKIEISEEQLAVFRTLKTQRANETQEVPIVNDFRPLQELHERRVYSNDIKTVDNLVAVVIEQAVKNACQDLQTGASSGCSRGLLDFAALLVALGVCVLTLA